jgi:ketosteroid isomerase-like protein
VSQGNVEIVRRSWEAFSRGDLDGFFADLAHDAEFEEDPAFPEAGIYRGREEISGYLRAFQEQMVSHRFEVEQLHDLGDRVLALLHESARGARSGLEVEQHPAFLYTFRANRIARVRAYLDRTEALEAVGLSE